MVGKTFNSGEYRYGFNGKEKDQNGEFGLTNYDNGFRIYNPGIGKFLSVDPLTRLYPMLTPFQFASNRPIDGIDLDGLEYVRRIHVINGEGEQIFTKDIVFYEMSESEIEAHGGTPAGW